MQIILRTLLLAFLFTLPAITAQASVCDATREGVIVYNVQHKLVQFCNGTQWIGLVAKIGGAGDELPSLSSAQIWVGDTSGEAAAVAMSGDATLSSDGVLNIANDAIIGPEISAGSITNSHLAGSIALSKIAITGTPDGTQFLRDDGTWQAVATSDTLAGLNCTSGQVAAWDGDNWECSDMGSGGGNLSAWQNVTANRAIATVYTNNTGGPLVVSITLDALGLTQQRSSLEIDGVAVSTITPSDYYSTTAATAHHSTLFGIVPTGATYSVKGTSGTPTLIKWFEATLGGSGTDTLAALQCAEQESLKFEGGAWVCAEINALPDPPICTGSSAALQWDGTNWSCATVVAGGGGGPTIVNGDHTQQECIDAGGTINMSDFGGDILCLFSGTTCPSGWTSYGKWYRTSKSCAGSTSCFPASGRDCTLPAGWVTTTASRSCTYKPSYPTCNGSCTQASGVGVTTAACY